VATANFNRSSKHSYVWRRFRLEHHYPSIYQQVRSLTLAGNVVDSNAVSWNFSTRQATITSIVETTLENWIVADGTDKVAVNTTGNGFVMLMKRIVFFGDSLTAGYGLAKPEVQSLPGLIQMKIDNAGFKYQVVNAGISGDTSSGG